jgi:hypothetical protein
VIRDNIVKSTFDITNFKPWARRLAILDPTEMECRSFTEWPLYELIITWSGAEGQGSQIGEDSKIDNRTQLKLMTDYITQIPSLRILHIATSRINAEMMAAILHSKIVTLKIYGTLITKGAIRELCRCGRLDILTLIACQLSSGRINDFSKMHKLRVLHLYTNTIRMNVLTATRLHYLIIEQLFPDDFDKLIHYIRTTPIKDIEINLGLRCNRTMVDRLLRTPRVMRITYKLHEEMYRVSNIICRS